MKFKLMFAMLLALLLGSNCRHTAPQPEQSRMSGEQAENATEPAAITEPSSGFDSQTLVCQAVLKKIYQASGDVSHPIPTVFLSENTRCMAAFFSRKNAIEVERQTYEVCRSFGADSLNALAIVLSHELSHAFDVEQKGSAFRSNFWAYNRQTGSSVEREKSADVRGAFMAHLAGYRIVPIVPTLIQKLYAAYPKQNQSAAYPSEAERRRTAFEVQGLVDTLIQVFDAANYLLAIGQSDMAAICYDHVLQVYKSPEIWNNYGIACVLEALRLPGEDGFAYPFELDWQLRLSRPRGPAPTEQQMRQRQALLQRSRLAFAEAIRLAPGYFSAQTNAWCVNVISGDVLDIQRDMGRFFQTRKMLQPESERFKLISALAAARAGDALEAENLLTQVTNATTPEIAALARYNLDVLKNGPDHAILQSADSNCPADPMALGLPSVLMLRRMAGAFDGLALGKDSELRLAWEKNANRMLLKARIGTNRFCILQLAPAPRTVHLPAAAVYNGFDGPSGTHLITCENQYLQVYKSGKMKGCGVFYDYRSLE
ncbi:MAG: hypothetical protein H7246_03700 [Phycisphaerae bacterium]|nr:hypothetical protein [Saprospiraceae bacterium]